MTDFDDHTQTDDNEVLESQLLKCPTFNPVHCEYVSPKRNEFFRGGHIYRVVNAEVYLLQ